MTTTLDVLTTAVLDLMSLPLGVVAVALVALHRVLPRLDGPQA